ncbi:MAG: phosphoribosylformylglycinamidine synthase subunit PurS [Enterococcus sp.]
MYLAKIHVTYKESILDPQGEAIKKAVHQLGYDAIQEIRMGKYFEVTIAENDSIEADKQIQEICEKLLTNVTMETYSYVIEQLEEA